MNKEHILSFFSELKRLNPTVAWDEAKIIELQQEVLEQNTLVLCLLGIRYIPSNIYLLQELEVLDIGGDPIEFIPSEVGNIINLRKLYLGGMPHLTHLPNTLGNLQQLEILYLDGVGLLSLPDWLGELSNLRELSIHSSPITTISSVIGRCSNLISLSLEGNKIHDLPNAFHRLMQLEICTLTDNPIRRIPSSLINSTSIDFLDLDKTLIPGQPILRSQIEIRTFFEQHPMLIGET